MMKNNSVRFLLTITVLLTLSSCRLPGSFPDQEAICQFDEQLHLQRMQSAQLPNQPTLHSVWINEQLVWDKVTLSDQIPVLKPGDEVRLTGEYFGFGPDIDYAKIMIGNSRVLETDLRMHEQVLAIQDQVNYEVPETHSEWAKDVLSWQPNEVRFRVPVHVSRGPLQIQVQKRLGFNASLLNDGQAHLVIDAQSFRIIDDEFDYACDVVSQLSAVASTQPLAVTVDNLDYAALVAKGQQAFWSYDYNIGVVHAFRELDWDKIFAGDSEDPIVGGTADPEKLFGAYKTVPGQVPSAAIDDVYFDTYPQPNPIPGFLTLESQLLKGNTRNSGYVGYRYAESSHPLRGKGEWIGFNCASCHGYPITYEPAPGQSVTRIFPGLPNPLWSVKWALLDEFEGIEADEAGPSWAPGVAAIDKSMLAYHLPQGTGEHTMIRGSDEGSLTDNDYEFSPIAIPNVTNHMPIRRSLSHTESYVGFEGSYIHAEEPDGSVGSMRADWLQALTTYMTQLDRHDNDLRRIGMYRWLQDNAQPDTLIGEGVSEGEFVQQGWQAYPALLDSINQGKSQFEQNCAACHQDQLGANTNEQMIRLDQVGRFFTPTIYQKEMQSIRATFIRNLYWVQHRGLLTDGHVRNIEDLINPNRCIEGTELYNNYYTLHAPVNPALGGADHPEPYPAYNRKGDVYRVPKSISYSPYDTAAKRNRFIERHKYFVEVPWDSDYYYWDYQKMRAEWGPDELGSTQPVGLPASPHPWCSSTADTRDLIVYLLTL